MFLDWEKYLVDNINPKMIWIGIIIIRIDPRFQYKFRLVDVFTRSFIVFFEFGFVTKI